jgi:hypothetical protein
MNKDCFVYTPFDQRLLYTIMQIKHDLFTYTCTHTNKATNDLDKKNKSSGNHLESIQSIWPNLHMANLLLKAVLTNHALGTEMRFMSTGNRYILTIVLFIGKMKWKCYASFQVFLFLRKLWIWKKVEKFYFLRHLLMQNFIYNRKACCTPSLSSDWYVL